MNPDPVNHSERLNLPPPEAVVGGPALLEPVSLDDSAVSRAEKIESNGIDAANNTHPIAKRRADCAADETSPAKRVKGTAPIKAQ